jgi:hypothetical protein
MASEASRLRDLCASDAVVEQWAARLRAWIPERREAFRIRPRKVLKVPLRKKKRANE